MKNREPMKKARTPQKGTRWAQYAMSEATSPNDGRLVPGR